MQKLQTAYTMYFNKKYQRAGSLFQGTFKAQHVTKDTYLKFLFAYINLNPIKLIDPEWKEKGIQNLVQAEKYLNDYMYSSYPDLSGGDRAESKILNMSFFPGYFHSISSFKDFITEWLTFKVEIESADKV